jgi:hypothetical protein
VGETLRVPGQRAKDYRTLFAEQGRWWQAETALMKTSPAKVETYAELDNEHPVTLDGVLALAREVGPHSRRRFWGAGGLDLGLEVVFGLRSGRGYPVGKHEDKHKDEQEKKQQSNGQVPPGTRISPKEPKGKHSAPDPDEEEK